MEGAGGCLELRQPRIDLLRDIPGIGELRRVVVADHAVRIRVRKVDVAEPRLRPVREVPAQAELEDTALAGRERVVDAERADSQARDPVGQVPGLERLHRFRCEPSVVAHVVPEHLRAVLPESPEPLRFGRRAVVGRGQRRAAVAQRNLRKVAAERDPADPPGVTELVRGVSFEPREVEHVGVVGSDGIRERPDHRDVERGGGRVGDAVAQHGDRDAGGRGIQRHERCERVEPHLHGQVVVLELDRDVRILAEQAGVPQSRQPTEIAGVVALVGLVRGAEPGLEHARHGLDAGAASVDREEAEREFHALAGGVREFPVPAAHRGLRSRRSRCRCRRAGTRQRSRWRAATVPRVASWSSSIHHDLDCSRNRFHAQVGNDESERSAPNASGQTAAIGSAVAGTTS